MYKSYDQRKKYVLIIYPEDGLKWKKILFGDNSKGDVIGLGKVAITLEHSITNVLHVDSLSYNLFFCFSIVWDGLQLSLNE